MPDMKSSFRFTVAALAFAAAAFPALAGAQQLGGTVELGATKSPVVAPACPSGVKPQDCTIILTRATALETIRDGVAYPTKVRQKGRVTAFTVGLSALSSNKTTQKSYIQYLNATYKNGASGTARVGITVLAPGGGKKTQWRWRVVASSPMYHVQPYLGSVVRIPLSTSIEVTPGEVVALTTTTWAPVLTIDVSSKQFAYRQSRSSNCAKPPAVNQAQLSPGQLASYSCNYPGTRLEYSATEDLYPLGTRPVLSSS
jgi:hypothetical protein